MTVQPPATSETAREFDYDRTVALSDGVFAIAMTLLVLNVGSSNLGPGRHVTFQRVISDAWPEILSYAISFAVLALIWVRHHAFFRSLRRIDTRLTGLNLTYLALVAFTPFPTRLLGEYGSKVGAVAVYAITLGCITLLTGAMRTHSVKSGLVAPGMTVPDSRRYLVTAGIFFGSIAIAVISPALAQIAWILAALLVGRVAARKGART